MTRCKGTSRGPELIHTGVQLSLRPPQKSHLSNLELYPPSANSSHSTLAPATLLLAVEI